MKKHFRQPNQSMSLDCKILFKKNASKAFYIGQTVHGYVHLVLEHEQLIQSIHVRINGTISAEWQHKHQTHQCQVNCLDHQISVLDDEKCLIAKAHRFPFQFKLPSSLPLSFDGEFGYIQYSVIVSIEMPFRPNVEVEEPIQIQKIIDKYDPELQRKLSVCERFNPYFVLSCVPWFPVQIDAHVEPVAHAPGAIIDVGINVTNNSFRRIRNFVVQLVEMVTYFSLDHLLKYSSMNVLSVVETRGCNSNQKYPICLGCQLKVPQVSLTNSTSAIVKVRHLIRITANMGRNYQPNLELPIIIIAISEEESLQTTKPNF